MNPIAQIPKFAPRMRKTLLPLLLSIMAFPVIAHAQLIDLAIYNSGNPETPSGAAVLGESGDQWNIVSAPISSSDPDSLKNVGGGDTSVTFSTDLPYLNYNSSSYGDLDPALFDNFAFTAASSA